MNALAVASCAAREAGVTRLADITRLDCVGVSVFQAVRPWSLALSVHQGKSLDPDSARMGALFEAMESDHAERFEGETRHSAFEDLPSRQRAADFADFSVALDAAPDRAAPLVWTPGRLMDGGDILWTPFDVVSLDFTQRGDPSLDRSSNGLAAGFETESATMTALLEVIERDAVHTWRASPIIARSRHRIDAETIEYDWFRALLGRLREAGLALSVHRVPAVVPLPVFMVELADEPGRDSHRGRALGAACRPDAEAALERSVCEAAQSRLATISGVRDDIFYPEGRRPSRHVFGLSLPSPTHMTPLGWNSVVARFPARPGLTSVELARLLAGAGYPQAAAVDLSRPQGSVKVVKALVPGLAGFDRARGERRWAA